MVCKFRTSDVLGDDWPVLCICSTEMLILFNFICIKLETDTQRSNWAKGQNCQHIITVFINDSKIQNKISWYRKWQMPKHHVSKNDGFIWKFIYFYFNYWNIILLLKIFFFSQVHCSKQCIYNSCHWKVNFYRYII